jgi:hypothetical protein
MREITAMIYNSHVKKADQKKPHKMYPLSIDSFKQWSYEDALSQYELMKKAGWVKNSLN